MTKSRLTALLLGSLLLGSCAFTGAVSVVCKLPPARTIMILLRGDKVPCPKPIEELQDWISVKD